MSDTATVIGENMRISGKLSGDEDLNVYGVVEGIIQLTESLLVESTGVVRANVAVRSAVISGVVIGNITASETVELTTIGRMVGDIIAPRVIIADGAAFRGHVEMADVKLSDITVATATATTTTARPSSRPTLESTRLPTERVRPTVERARPPLSSSSRPARMSPSRPVRSKPAPKPVEEVAVAPLAATVTTATATIEVEPEAVTRPDKSSQGGKDKDNRKPKRDASGPKKPRRKKS